MPDDFATRLAADQRKCAARFERARREYSRTIRELRSGGDHEHRNALAMRARRAYDRAEDAARDVLACFESDDHPAAQHWTIDAIRAQLDAIGTIADANEAGRAAHLENLAALARELDRRDREYKRSLPY